MTTSSLAKLLWCAALVFMAVSLLQKPLGLNEWVQPILGLVAVLLLWTGIWLQRRAKPDGEPARLPSAQQRRNRFLLLAAILVVTSLTGPFWLPFLGPELPMPQLIIASLIACVASLTTLAVAARRGPPKA